MKISEIVEKLQKIQQEHGDLPVCGYNREYDEYLIFISADFEDESCYMNEKEKLITEPYVYLR